MWEESSYFPCLIKVFKFILEMRLRAYSWNLIDYGFRSPFVCYILEMRLRANQARLMVHFWRQLSPCPWPLLIMNFLSIWSYTPHHVDESFTSRHFGFGKRRVGLVGMGQAGFSFDVCCYRANLVTSHFVWGHFMYDHFGSGSFRLLSTLFMKVWLEISHFRSFWFTLAYFFYNLTSNLWFWVGSFRVQQRSNCSI